MGHGNPRKLNGRNFINSKIYTYESIFRHMLVRVSKSLEQLSSELSSLMEEFQAVAYMRGFHVFKDIWEAALSEESMCERELYNQRDRYVKCSLQINIRSF